MGKSLYRQYRSTSFDEIIGQDHIVAVLKNTLKNDSISHAYLLSGPRGVGKTSTARILAHAVNEIAYEGEDLNLDIIEIDAASNRRIDEIREIRDKVNIAPVAGKYKVYIIDEVHMLTREAFNALLKTLEEPPAHVIFILATTESYKVPETILSRCINLNFKPISEDILENHLKKIAKEEKITISDQAIAVLSKHANGSFRDGISLLEQVKYFGDKIEESDVNSLLGLVSTELIKQIFDSINNLDLQELNNLLDKAYESGANEASLASQLSEYLRQNLINGSGVLAPIQTIDTLKALLLVPGSPEPRIELELVLNSLIIANLTESNMSQKHHDITKPTAPDEETVQQTAPVHQVIEKPKVKESVHKIPEKIDQKATNVNGDLWNDFLNELKARNNTLYGVARMADIKIDGNVLSMGFNFAFHYKKINDAKNIAIFNEILTSIGQDKITLEIYQKESVEKINPDDIKTISNIFGSTEVLE